MSPTTTTVPDLLGPLTEEERRQVRFYLLGHLTEKDTQHFFQVYQAGFAQLQVCSFDRFVPKKIDKFTKISELTFRGRWSFIFTPARKKPSRSNKGKKRNPKDW